VDILKYVPGKKLERMQTSVEGGVPHNFEFAQADTEPYLVAAGSKS
jgi:hypothetical protein